MDVQNHAGWIKLHNFVWMGGDVVKKLLDMLFSSFCWASLLASDGNEDEGGQKCEVNCSYVVK